MKDNMRINMMTFMITIVKLKRTIIIVIVKSNKFLKTIIDSLIIKIIIMTNKVKNNKVESFKIKTTNILRKKYLNNTKNLRNMRIKILIEEMIIEKEEGIKEILNQQRNNIDKSDY
jgi:hypothetical protein